MTFKAARSLMSFRSTILTYPEYRLLAVYHKKTIMYISKIANIRGWMKSRISYSLISSSHSTLKLEIISFNSFNSNISNKRSISNIYLWICIAVLDISAVNSLMVRIYYFFNLIQGVVNISVFPDNQSICLNCIVKSNTHKYTWKWIIIGFW